MFQPNLKKIEKWNFVPGLNDSPKTSIEFKVFNSILSKSVKEISAINKIKTEVHTKLTNSSNKRKSTSAEQHQPKIKNNKLNSVITRKNYFLKLSNSDLCSCYANVCIQLMLSCGKRLFDEVNSQKSLYQLFSDLINNFKYQKVKLILNNNTGLNQEFETLLNEFIDAFESRSTIALSTMVFRQYIDQKRKII